MTSFILLVRCFLYTFFIFVRSELFCAFLCLWNLFVKKNKKLKTDLITSFILLLISNLFNFKDVVNTKLSSHIVYKFKCSSSTQLIMVKLKDISLWELLSIWILLLWLVNLLKRPKNLLFLICYWMIIKLVLTIFRYF